ncbi:MAG: SpoIID/LytB domain-containing protein, partial [Candidatus Omnitrophica bacterium]|nr:SpoIID/LytB domain-containing protein [Candidatus Omnitrophota bacterium]
LGKAINFYPEAEVVSEKLKAVKQRLGEGFFRAQREKKEEERKVVKLTTYAQEEEDIPVVRVGLAMGAEKFSFFCSGNFLISNGKDFYSALANKFYTLVLKDEKIVLKDYQDKEEYESFSGPLNITSLESKNEKPPFYVLSLSSGKGEFWNKERDRAYRGDLEVFIDDEALTLVNILSVEEYLYGVLSAEMSSKANIQALRAQAAAARTFVFKNLRRHEKGGFNFCSLVHCQAYQGISAETPSTIAAVRDTRGEVIVYEDRPIEVLFHAHCGGCLASDVFGESNYLEEKTDSLDLDIPSSAYAEENWFSDLPLVFCREDKGSKLRWQRVYDREDFSIAFGKRLEDLKDIVLKVKGDCFHYKEIEVITATGSENLKGDLTIRNYFDHLRSSAFKIEKKISIQGQPSMLFFWGAGFGHGAGMCQDGAVGMAEDGYSWHQIINHYFPNTKIKKLY